VVCIPLACIRAQRERGWGEGGGGGGGGERERETEVLLTIKELLKVAKHNALSEGRGRERAREKGSFKSFPFSKIFSFLFSLSLLSRAPRGGVTRQGVVLTDLQSLLDCQ
jgi:hypothetical protein